MEWLWYVWPLCLFAGIVIFAVFEAIALKHSEDGPTLSRFMWTIGQKWPLSLVLFGMTFGGLAVHFYWNWCPLLGSTNG